MCGLTVCSFVLQKPGLTSCFPFRSTVISCPAVKGGADGALLAHPFPEPLVPVRLLQKAGPIVPSPHPGHNWDSRSRFGDPSATLVRNSQCLRLLRHPATVKALVRDIPELATGSGTKDRGLRCRDRQCLVASRQNTAQAAVSEAFFRCHMRVYILHSRSRGIPLPHATTDT